MHKISILSKSFKDVSLITNKSEDYNSFVSKVKAEDFELFSINENILKEIKGHIGNLQVIVVDDEEGFILNVFKSFWFDANKWD